MRFCRRLQRNAAPPSRLLIWILCLSFLLAPSRVFGSGIVQPSGEVVAYEPQAVSFAVVSLTAVASTDIINVTEAGKLISIGFRVNATLSGSNPTVDLDITIDGGTTRSTVMYDGGSLSWPNEFQAIASREVGVAGNTIDDLAFIQFNTPYKTSLQVALNVTTAVGTAGTLTVVVLRGVEL